jgi:predicted amidohydrolase
MRIRQVWCWIGLLAALSLGPIAAKGDNGVKPLAHFQDFTRLSHPNEASQGWTTWVALEKLAPRFAVDPTGGRTGKGALEIQGAGNPVACGAWRCRVDGIVGGRVYRFHARYRAQGIPYERRSVWAKLDWLDAKGERVAPPDHAMRRKPEGAWTPMEHIAPAPPEARSVRIELAFGWAPKGVVWWDDIEIGETTAPRERLVRMMTIYHRPSETGSAARSVQEFCHLIEAAAIEKPDIVCLPEGITVVGTGKSYAEVSEPVPGPTTQTLGALAKKLRCYIVAGLYERAGEVIYNTAVLIGRSGEVVGTYRKTHLPREEVEAGLTPGDSYPVFQTDFGKVGLMICWDVQFPEPARAMALQGAEILLLPIWGGSEVLARARAIENHVFLVSSSYDMKTFIVNPAGEVLAEATEQHPAAVAEVSLDRKIVQPWLGDMKERTWKERRPDIPVEAPK